MACARTQVHDAYENSHVRTHTQHAHIRNHTFCHVDSAFFSRVLSGHPRCAVIQLPVSSRGSFALQVISLSFVLVFFPCVCAPYLCMYLSTLSIDGGVVVVMCACIPVHACLLCTLLFSHKVHEGVLRGSAR